MAGMGFDQRAEHFQAAVDDAAKRRLDRNGKMERMAGKKISRPRITGRSVEFASRVGSRQRAFAARNRIQFSHNLCLTQFVEKARIHTVCTIMISGLGPEVSR